MRLRILLSALVGVVLLNGTPPSHAQSTLMAWGNNESGKLGTGLLENSKYPLNTNGYLNYTSISVNERNTIVLRADGTVWMCGSNANGQLGQGTSGGSSNAFLQVKSPDGSGFLTGMIGVACGANFALALKYDGTVWAWGGNTYGQLGDGTSSSHFYPNQVYGLTNIIQIGAGTGFAMALQSNGNVWTWGHNFNGQLGRALNFNTSNPNPYPDIVNGLPLIRTIACGAQHALAIANDATNTLWGWGEANSGEIGNYSGRLTTPVKTGLTDVIPDRIAAGYDASYAVTATYGYVWGTGYNGYAAMGNPGGSLFNKGFAHIPGISNPILSVAGGNNFGAAVLYDNTVWTWGYGQYGRLGRNFDSSSGYAPGQVIIYDVRSVHGGGLSEHLFALTNTGFLAGWGANHYGQMGTGEAASFYTSPKFPVTSLFPTKVEQPVAISAGAYNSLALQADGTVKVWGGFYLGNEAFRSSLVPQTLTDTDTNEPLTEVRAVEGGSGGLGFNALLKKDGTVLCWGNNTWGQLGDGTNTTRNRPTAVSGLDQVQEIAAGQGFVVARHADGTVWAWGLNNVGQLGNTTFDNSNVPVQVYGLSNIIAIAAGRNHALALESNGLLWAWGGNERGQLGVGEVDTVAPFGRSQPWLVLGIVGPQQIAAGNSYSLALTPEGFVACWGRNAEGQLGDGTLTDASILTYVKDPSGQNPIGGVSAIAAGSHSLAILNDTSVYAWGPNNSGQLGDNTTITRSLPVPVTGIFGFGTLQGGTHLSAKYGSSLAVVSPLATVSGTISIPDLANGTGQWVLFTFRPMSGSKAIFKRYLYMTSADTAYSFSDIPAQGYTLHVKSYNTLAANVAVTVPEAGVSEVNATILPGDANDDNSIDIFDLATLAEAFNTTPDDVNWNFYADFNGDRSVDIFDLAILAENFNTQGDP